MALDGTRLRRSTTAMMVIADDDGVQALGGIMGGEATGCTEEHDRRLLEVGAVRPGAHRRRPGRAPRHRIPMPATASSAASIRASTDLGHRGRDPADPRTLRRRGQRARSSPATCPGCADASSVPPGRRRTACGGVDMPAERAAAHPRPRSASRRSRPTASLRVSVPSWRDDIDGEADLVEEVLRVAGLSTRSRPSRCRGDGALPAGREPRASARRACAAPGAGRARPGRGRDLFLHRRARGRRLFGGGRRRLRLANPISADLDDMRPSILPEPDRGGRAQRRRAASPIVALFEVGPPMPTPRPRARRWSPPACARAGPARATGPRRRAAGRCLRRQGRRAGRAGRLRRAGRQRCRPRRTRPRWYHPGRSGALRLGPKTVLAAFGEMHPRVLCRMDVAGPVRRLRGVPRRDPRAQAGRAARRGPPLDAVALPAGGARLRLRRRRRASRPKRCCARCRAADKALVADVAVFDVYRRQGHPRRARSRSPSR